MMNKIFTAVIAAAVCTSALSVTAFAEDILSDKSVYTKNQQSILQAIGSWESEGRKISPDPNTIIPLYRASVYDYAKTGNFDVVPLTILDKDGNPTEGQQYISDAIDEDGNFAGIFEFVYGGENTRIVSFTSSAKNDIESVAFNSDAKRINSLMKKSSLNTNCNNIKLVFADGLGFVYYIDNGEERLLGAANLGGVNGNFFNNENGGLIVMDENFKGKADAELELYSKYLEDWQKILATLDPNDPLPAGGYETPTFKVDNTPYLNSADNNGAASGEKNPNTGRGVGAALGAAALLSLTAGAVVVSKRRKDN